MPIHRTCETCGAAFLTRASQIAIGNGRYCSAACSSAHRRSAHLPAITFSEDGTVAFIPLHRRDGSIRARALIDADDAAWAGQWRWSLNTGGYASRQVRIDGKPHTIRLHRELLGLVPGDGLEVDHWNRCRLDDRRANLRVVPKGIQIQNSPGWRNASSPYRGVSWHTREQKWIAGVTVDGKKMHLGEFTDEEQAAAVAREARLKMLRYAVD